ncbi:hypothetical protein THASP1DRAFT_28199 [Thamnocephalis sphaerospora]|uniref:Uncharacterized protein n=1 Tax=Thamnocephalis sphaerospora TaxID=78915 RepID=A0A4P9XUT8_9FUNG|nr:hypothetical protein THASP1DRAFT_28199 [Thamnocephalis sphaerospora]|eukprot:RKP10014.1 hypothetical protein THASP1DRAFT_28199 [Thamnocephalis sphaerospora]
MLQKLPALARAQALARVHRESSLPQQTFMLDEGNTSGQYLDPAAAPAETLIDLVDVILQRPPSTLPDTLIDAVPRRHRPRPRSRSLPDSLFDTVTADAAEGAGRSDRRQRVVMMAASRPQPMPQTTTLFPPIIDPPQRKSSIAGALPQPRQHKRLPPLPCPFKVAQQQQQQQQQQQHEIPSSPPSASASVVASSSPPPTAPPALRYRHRPSASASATTPIHARCEMPHDKVPAVEPNFVAAQQTTEEACAPATMPQRVRLIRQRSSSVTNVASAFQLLRIVLSARDYITLRVPADVSLSDLTNMVVAKCLRCGRRQDDLTHRVFIWERCESSRTLGVVNDTILREAFAQASVDEHITLYWT